ncbi:Elongator complex protein [Mycena kentingensis (nom. inval.)]|nr:Elongator complex protein [Mycena kentingensis (nom. inval.)]
MSTYISASTNRFPGAAHIADASLVAFGSSNIVALWDTRDARGVSSKLWIETCKIQAHPSTISALFSLGYTLVTSSSDGTSKIWSLSPDAGMESYNKLRTSPSTENMCYHLRFLLYQAPKVLDILAIGATDRNIHIWTRSGDTFIPSAILSGHEDWVKCLAFDNEHGLEGPLTLASGSQDATIRLWRIDSVVKQTPDPDDFLDAFEASLGELADTEEGGRQISLKHHILTVKSGETHCQYSITFDALLIGHEAGVTSLCWRNSSATPEPALLSTSTDSSVILWSPSTIRGTEESTIWTSHQRFGDVGGQRLGGFVGGLWAQDGTEALAWGWAGGWRRWRCTAEQSWSEISAITGHSAPVKSLAWSPNGEYLISAGLDQTTRIHGPVVQPTGAISWRELARPQVHGYDMLDVAFLDPLKFVSIADEKVARVFEAPGIFVDLVENLGIARFAKQNRPVAANVPPLGLSNKAMTDVVSPAAPSPGKTSKNPFEGELAGTTLWPEIEKVFGHGYESMSLAVSNSKKLIATTCKASTTEHAVVRVYDTEKWQPFGEPLAGHHLTVTRIAFSPDDRFLLSVSRDRSWRLFELNQSETGYAPVAADKSHGRIIWDCAWTKEGDIFATASRDKTVKLWKLGADSKWSALETFKLHEAATAVDFAPVGAGKPRHVSIGLESGAILVYAEMQGQWRAHLTLDSRVAHVGPIHRLSWRPPAAGQNSNDGDLMELASCSEDGTLTIVMVRIAIYGV